MQRPNKLQPGDILTTSEFLKVVLSVFIDWLPISYAWGVYVEMAKDLNLSMTYLGLFLGLGGIGQYVGGRLFTKAVKATDKRLASQLSWVAPILSLAFFSFVQNAWSLAAVIFFMGSAGFSPAIASAYVAAYTTKEQRSSKYLQATVVVGLAIFLGPMFFGFLNSKNITFAEHGEILCGLAMAAFLIKKILPQTQLKEVADEDVQVNQELTLKWSANAKKYLVVFICLSLVGNIIGYFYPIFLRNVHNNANVLAGLFSFIGLTTITAPFVAGLATKFMKEHTWLVWSNLAMAVAVVFCASTTNLWLGSAAYLMWALIGDCISPLTQSALSKEFSSEQQIIVAKVRSDISAIGGILGNFFGGFLFSFIGIELFWWSVAICFIGFFSIYSIKNNTISGINNT